MFEERPQQGLLCSGPLERIVDGLPEVSDILRDEVGQIPVLGSCPHLFIRIEVGSIRRQPFNPQSTREALLKPESGRAMRLRAIQDQDESARQVDQQVRRKSFDLRRTDVVLVQRKVETQSTPPGRDGNGRDRRETVVPIPTVLNRRAASRCPCAAEYTRGVY